MVTDDQHMPGILGEQDAVGFSVNLLVGLANAYGYHNERTSRFSFTGSIWRDGGLEFVKTAARRKRDTRLVGCALSRRRGKGSQHLRA